MIFRPILLTQIIGISPRELTSYGTDYSKNAIHTFKEIPRCSNYRIYTHRKANVRPHNKNNITQ